MDYGRLFLQLTLAWGVLSLFLLILAWRKAAGGNTAVHRMLMIMLTVGAWLFVLSYLLRFIIPGYNAPDIPKRLIPWFVIHGTVGTFILLGATALVYARIRGSKEAFLNRHHRLIGRVTAGLWCFTHLGGLVNIWLLI